MSGALSVPDKKLVADLLFGVLKGGDVLVSDIAGALSEGNTLDSTEVRLTNAMKWFDYAGLDDAMQKSVFGIFSDPYSLAVDESDIGKEQAKSMEGLCTVKDGPKSGEVFHQGYHMTGLVAIGGRKRNPMILCYDIFPFVYTKAKDFGIMFLSPMVKVFNFDDNPNEFSANTYVIGKIGYSCFVVDIGSNKAEVTDYIDSHYEKVAGVLLTHAHADHVRGLPALLRHYKYEIPVYLNDKDKPLLTDPKLNVPTMEGDENLFLNINTISVVDGEEIVYKNTKIQVIHTPFHTQGSVCYFFEDDNALFTGDTLFKGSIGRTDLPTSHPETIASSLRKLSNLSDYLVIYPGHGSISHLGVEKENNPYFKAALL